MCTADIEAFPFFLSYVLFWHGVERNRTPDISLLCRLALLSGLLSAPCCLVEQKKLISQLNSSNNYWRRSGDYKQWKCWLIAWSRTKVVLIFLRIDHTFHNTWTGLTDTFKANFDFYKMWKLIQQMFLNTNCHIYNTKYYKNIS